MTRRLLNLLTVLSLLLCVAVAARWVRSCMLSDFISHTSSTGRDRFVDVTQWILETGRGTVTVTRCRAVFLAEDEAEWGDVWEWNAGEPFNPTFRWAGIPTVANRFGFQWNTGRDRGADGSATGRHTAGCALWVPAALFAALPMAWTFRQLRRRPVGLCPTCGYDLRATPDHCPECGTPKAVPA